MIPIRIVMLLKDCSDYLMNIDRNVRVYPLKRHRENDVKIPRSGKSELIPTESGLLKAKSQLLTADS